MLEIHAHMPNPGPPLSQVALCGRAQFGGGILRIGDVVVEKREIKPFHV